MKQSVLNIKRPLFLRVVSLLVFFLLVMNTNKLYSQTSDTKQGDSTAAEAPELISPSLSFVATQKGDNSIDLKARLRGKVNGQTINFYKMKVTFSQVVNEEATPLGSVVTDGRGNASLNVKSDSLKTNADGTLSFKASFAGNKSMDVAEETATMKKAHIELTPVKEDSALSVTVKLLDESTGTPTPVKDATIGIFVKRSFLPLKIAEGTTDENGEATIEFPNGLPGDKQGNLTILGRLDENETYGNVETSTVQKWGTPVNDKIEIQQRALWSTHPPLWMLITFIILMTTVWGHYIVIIFELFRLRKEEPKTIA